MNKIKGTNLNVSKLTSDDKTPLPRTEFARRMIIGTVSDKTLAAIEKLTLDQPPPAIVQTSAPAKPEPADAREKALGSQLVALALGAPEFQRK